MTKVQEAIQRLMELSAKAAVECPAWLLPLAAALLERDAARLAYYGDPTHRSMMALSEALQKVESAMAAAEAALGGER